MYRNKYFSKESEWYISIIKELEDKYKSKFRGRNKSIQDSYIKCDKPFKKRYPKNDPNKSVSKKPILVSKKSTAVSNKTGIDRLKEKRLKGKQ